jgi:hypothetical protein
MTQLNYNSSVSLEAVNNRIKQLKLKEQTEATLTEWEALLSVGELTAARRAHLKVQELLQALRNSYLPEQDLKELEDKFIELTADLERQTIMQAYDHLKAGELKVARQLCNIAQANIAKLSGNPDFSKLQEEADYCKANLEVADALLKELKTDVAKAEILFRTKSAQDNNISNLLTRFTTAFADKLGSISDYRRGEFAPYFEKLENWEKAIEETKSGDAPEVLKQIEPKLAEGQFPDDKDIKALQELAQASSNGLYYQFLLEQVAQLRFANTVYKYLDCTNAEISTLKTNDIATLHTDVGDLATTIRSVEGKVEANTAKIEASQTALEGKAKEYAEDQKNAARNTQQQLEKRLLWTGLVLGIGLAVLLIGTFIVLLFSLNGVSDKVAAVQTQIQVTPIPLAPTSTAPAATATAQAQTATVQASTATAQAELASTQTISATAQSATATAQAQLATAQAITATAQAAVKPDPNANGISLNFTSPGGFESVVEISANFRNGFRKLYAPKAPNSSIIYGYVSNSEGEEAINNVNTSLTGQGWKTAPNPPTPSKDGALTRGYYTKDSSPDIVIIAIPLAEVVSKVPDIEKEAIPAESKAKTMVDKINVNPRKTLVLVIASNELIKALTS